MKSLFSLFTFVVSSVVMFVVTTPSLVVAQQVQPPEVEWEKTFGGARDDWGNSVQQTTDGGYIVAGVTSDSFGTLFPQDIYLIKTDAQGNIAPGWPKTFGGADDDSAHSVQQTSDGGYIVAGWTNGRGGIHTGDIYLIKTDANGIVAPGFPKTFGGTSTDSAHSVQQTSDGGYIVAGFTFSFGAGNSDVYLVKTDSQGKQVWQNTYGGANNDEGFSVQQTTDGGYIVAGETWSFGDRGADVYLVKTDSQGKQVWQNTYGGALNDEGFSVQQTTDGGYIVAGITYSDKLGGGSFNVFLVKTDSLSNRVWWKTYGGADDDSAYSVQQTSDGGYIVAGRTSSFGAGGSDVYLIKLKPETSLIDCNKNGIDDAQDIASGTSKDCNLNKIPDECDIAAKISWDQNSDGIPDECQISLDNIQLYYFEYSEANPSASLWKKLPAPFTALNPQLPTAVIVHGWNDGINNIIDGKPSWNLQMADAMYGRLDKKVNILGWDWASEAAWIVPPGWRVPSQAQRLANTLEKILSFRAYDKTKPIHLMGHSLGAHLVAWTGVRMMQSGLGYLPRQVTCWDPPEAYLGDAAQLRLPNICIPLQYLREHSTAENYCYTEFYHGNTSALAHNAELWVNVPNFTHKVPEWYLETIKKPNPGLKGWLFEDIGGTIGFGTSAILPDSQRPDFAYCGAGNFESLAFDATAVTNEYRRRFFCRNYVCFCFTDECQNILNPEPVDLTNCVCDPAQICEREVNRVVIHIPGKGIFKVTIRVHIKINWYYFNFDCDTSGAPTGTGITCVIDDGGEKDTLWQAGPDPFGSGGPAPSGFVDIRNHRGKDVDIEYEVVCDDERGGTVVISNPEFSEGPSPSPDPPQIPPRLPDIPDVVLTNQGDSRGTVRLQCPPCIPIGEDITEYVWLVDGDYVAGEVFVDIELEIGVHVVTLCMMDKFNQQTCAEKTVRVKGEYEFTRGDANADGQADITDAIAILTWLFLKTDQLPCADAADIDDNATVDISDPIALLSFLFLGDPWPKPAPPYPNPGLDPTPDLLGCDIKPK